MSEPAAFFDLDRTLIDTNSGLLWALHERRAGNISRVQLARAIFWTALYHLSLVDIERAIDEATQHYRGVSRDALDSRTREWFMSEVKPRLRPGAALAIDQHKRAGHPIVILTNSSCFEASVAAESWGFDAWLANEFPTDDQGRLIGTCSRPLCYARGKVAHAERWARESGADLNRSYFYSDSFSDVPMLERVGHPRVVSPDPRLRRHARKRGWAILDW